MITLDSPNSGVKFTIVIDNICLPNDWNL